MKLTYTLFLVLILSLIGIIANAKSNYTINGKEVVPGRLLVKMKADNLSAQFNKSLRTSKIQTIAQKIGATSQKNIFLKEEFSTEQQAIFEEVGLDRWVVFTVEVPADLERLINQLKKDPSVEIVEPDYICEMHATPNDPNYIYQQHLPQIKAPEAWDIQKGDATVIIAIIDTGVDWDHPDLTASIWSNPNEIPNNGIDDDNNGYIDDIRGWDFVSGVTGGTGTTAPDPNDDLTIQDNDPMDFNGHGTHCAGIAAAATNNSVGVASISWGCKIMPLRIGFRTNNGSGSGYSTWMAQAFLYAADNGASVASLSFGNSGQLIIDASLYAFKRGVVICNSAGNGNNESSSALGSVPWVLKVASVDDLDRKASYSTYGTWVNISAPGGDQSAGRSGILSTVVNPSSFYGGKLYEYFQGTSMACPLVAGLAGLVKSKFPTMNSADIVFQICATSNDISSVNPNYVGKLGYGRINAQNAVTAIAPVMKPALSFSSVRSYDGAGNNNEKVEPGETIEMVINLKNEWENATNVTASISTTSWGISITKPSVSYGTILGIRDVDNSIKGNESDRFIFSVSSDSIPRSIIFNMTVTADQGYLKEFEIQVNILPSLLFVDDDDGSVNVESYYINAFRSLGLVFEYWNRAVQGQITATQLSNYKTVVWGCEWAFPSLDANDRSAIGQFLDNGGQLFLSGQDIGWDLCASDGVEYLTSGGASKTWFEKYINASYLADNAGTTSLIGVSSDPIGNGLNISFTEPLRSSTNQYPDVISPLSGAVSIFNYPNSTSGAVRSSSTWKVVYFGFGGFEAISSEFIRKTVMERIFNWFNGFQFKHEKLKDTESSEPRLVQVEISSSNVTESVNLYWDTDGSFPFNKVTMNSVGGGRFEAYIPGQSNTTVEYTTIVRTSGGYMPYTINSYKAGADITPPVILYADSIGNTLSTTGIFTVALKAEDNLGVDPDKVYIHFKFNNSELDSSKLNYINNNQYSGAFNLSNLTSIVNAKDVVSYYYSVQDASSQSNYTKYPSTGFYSLVIGRQLIDDFNINRPIWDLGLRWGYEQSTKNSVTSNAMSDSPGGPYLPNTENTLTFTQAFDLKSFSWARLYFWRAMAIHISDTMYVEYKKSKSDWVTIRKMNGTFPNTWRKDSVDVPGSDGEMYIRFRLKSDATNESAGILLDDIELVSSSYLATAVGGSQVSIIPQEYNLYQSYPNPFNPSTAIRYELPKTSSVTLIIFDMLGREVTRLVNERQEAGTYTTIFEAQKLASGIYFYRLSADNYISTKKMILIR